MRFTASTNWDSIARGSSKVLTWSVYVRRVTATTASLSSGSWTDVSNYVTELPDVTAQVEYDVGAFSTDNVGIIGTPISYWSAALSSSIDERIEVKVQVALSRGSTTASDTCIIFSGFVDVPSIQYDELLDQVAFTVYSPKDLGTSTLSEMATTRYIDPDMSGTSYLGLTLPAIFRLFVTKSNVAGFELAPGYHTIDYEYVGVPDSVPPYRRAALDGGRWVTLANGDNTLGNGENTASEDTQRLVLYTDDIDQLPRATYAPTGTLALSDEVIVTDYQTSLPRNRLTDVTVKQALGYVLPFMGAASWSFEGSMSVPTWDTSQSAFIVDGPPATTGSIADPKPAIASDGTDLFIAVGQRVYWRKAVDESYTVIATLPNVLDRVSRMVWNAAHNDLILNLGTNTDTGNRYHGKWARVRRSGDTFTLSAIVTGSGTTGYSSNWQVVDDAGLPSGKNYAVWYVDTAARHLRYLDLENIGTQGIIASQSDFGCSGGGQGPQAGVSWYSGGWYYLPIYSGSTNYYGRVGYVAATWEYEPNWKGGLPTVGISQGGYVAKDNLVYYYDFNVGPSIRSWSPTTETTASVLSFYSGYTAPYDWATSASSSWVGDTALGILYKLQGGVATRVSGSGLDLVNGVYCSGDNYGTVCFTTMSGDGDLWGLNAFGQLFSAGSRLPFTLSSVDPSTGDILTLFNDICRAFNLVAIWRWDKTVQVYRRFDDTGSAVTTGNTVNLTAVEASQVTLNPGYIPGAKYVAYEGGGQSDSWDGTTYGRTYLDSGNGVVVSADWLRPQLLRSLCKWAYQFYRTKRDLYTLDLGVLPLFQYEVLDNVNVQLSGTKITKTVSGDGYPIYGITYRPDGSLTVKVLI